MYKKAMNILFFWLTWYSCRFCLIKIHPGWILISVFCTCQSHGYSVANSTRSGCRTCLYLFWFPV